MKTAITVLIILMSVATFLCAQSGIVQPAPATDTPDQFADLCWVLLLCVFSLFARTAGKSRYRYHFLSIAFLLLLLASFHSHPLWKFAAPQNVSPQGSQKTQRRIKIRFSTSAPSATSVVRNSRVLRT